jgi:hypothetical protein
MPQRCSIFYFEPRVWDLGFQLGFALHCVALLCAVCVRLPLVCIRLTGLFFSRSL